MSPVIVTAAITGGIHTPTMSPYLPVTPAQIAQQAIEAAEAGAAVVHLHARDPETGASSANQDYFREIGETIKAKSDVVMCFTTGGGLTQTIDERMAVVPTLEPELCSCNMGSINFALFPLVDKFKEWKHDWEPQMLAASKDFIFRNTFGDLERICQITRETNTKPEFEIYDVGHLHNLKFIIQAGWIKPPVYLQFVLGILGGMGASIDSLVTLRQTADRLLGPDNYVCSGFGGGRAQFPICTTNALMGGHCRVGLEDSVYIEKGVLAESNAQQVTKMIRILKEFSLSPASPAEARQILGLKGLDKTKL